MNKRQVKTKMITARGPGSWGGVTSGGRIERLDPEKMKIAQNSDFWYCPECASRLPKLKAVHNNADEFFCPLCKISILCFIETMGPVDSNWPPRNLPGPNEQ